MIDAVMTAPQATTWEKQDSRACSRQSLGALQGDRRWLAVPGQLGVEIGEPDNVTGDAQVALPTPAAVHHET